MSSRYLRGTVWEYEFAAGEAPKPAVVVSSNHRNASAWPMMHVVRITTAPKQPRPTIVELPAGGAVSGRVMCDDLVPVAKAALRRQLGSLPPAAMRALDEALRTVLAL